MNYYLVLYSLNGLVAKNTDPEKGKPPIIFKSIGQFKSVNDAVMVSRAMTKASAVVRNFIFHYKHERWCLFNEQEFKTLLSEIGIKPKKGHIL